MKTKNEDILDYTSGSSERSKFDQFLEGLKSMPVDIPLIIGGQDLKTSNWKEIHSPYDHSQYLGRYCLAGKNEITSGIESALDAKSSWERTPFQERASIFLKAADLVAGKYRNKLNASTMLGQGKNIYQAEIDCIAEFADFLRFNVEFAHRIFEIQPSSSEEVENKLHYRPLEGFVVAITPFNFTAIAGNLSCAPALMGNTVIWKPSDKQMYSAVVLMEIFKEAGLPDGVINMVQSDPQEFCEACLSHPEFAGLHFTGSSAVFDALWKQIGSNISIYKNYPKIVGETGGKDFVFVDVTAKLPEVATALIRGAFEYQGQKCSAASRAYVPKSKWNELFEIIKKEMKKVSVGSPEEHHFINSVISRDAFDRAARYIEDAKANKDCTIALGGNYDDSVGYYVDPTIILCDDSKAASMTEEIFAPILSVYLYEDMSIESICEIIDDSEYALTGAIFAEGEDFIKKLTYLLRNTAGNFYINDKPTGAVVDRQPFGGARKSGTNDKAGSMLNLLRWVSPQTQKRNNNPPSEIDYPFMK